MDPDSGELFKRSTITKIAILTLLFTACYFYKDRTRYRSRPVQMATQRPLTADDSIAQVVKPQKKKKKKKIYLTFDDGPNKGTQQMLDIVNAEQVPVTLFLIGEHVYGSSLQARVYDSIMASSWVEIANHSFTHGHNRFSKFYQNADSVVQDFNRCADSLGLKNGIARTPGRNIWRLQNIRKTDISTSAAAADSLHKNGFLIVGWDLEWHFDKELKAVQSPEKLWQEVDSMFRHKLTQSGDHLVLLAHDQVYANTQDSSMLRKFVAGIKQQDEYEFAYVSRYPGIEKIPQGDSLSTKK
jgi:peptidoglycan/xylan/chitin deacetylase (PgdA/CDA1 family)